MSTEVSTLLQTHGIAPTPQRTAIFAVLQGREDHPDVDTVFSELREGLPTLSKTTVYQTMQVFVRKGLIMEVHAEDGTLRYDPNPGFHAHFKCRTCGGLYDLKIAEQHEQPYVPMPSGFKPDCEEVVYYGRCPKCD